MKIEIVNDVKGHLSQRDDLFSFGQRVMGALIHFSSKLVELTGQVSAIR